MPLSVFSHFVKQYRRRLGAVSLEDWELYKKKIVRYCSYIALPNTTNYYFTAILWRFCANELC